MTDLLRTDMSFLGDQTPRDSTLHVRHVGRVAFHEADSLARALHKSCDDYLLLLEHPPVYTCGSGTKPEHLKSAHESGIDVVDVDRGGSITYHGPGQIIGYPIVSIPQSSGDLRASLRYIRDLEEVLIESLSVLGVEAIRKEGYTGVWIDSGQQFKEQQRYKKIAAIGVKVAQGRTRHGFALNVSPDLSAFNNIVPCGIDEYGVTSLAEIGLDHITLDEVEETVTKCFVEKFSYDAVSSVSVKSPSSIVVSEFTRDGGLDIAPDVSSFSSAVSAAQPQIRLLGRLAKAGVAVDDTKDRTQRPEWMKNKFRASDGYQELKDLARGLDLHTVCEEAGCPNIYECWESKTATFMILGERCTRACGFCLVDTRKPMAPDSQEPRNVALAVEQLGLEYAVITCVARDDLEDDGSTQFVETVREIRKVSPSTQIELLISDCRGHVSSLDAIFHERPEVLNHNIETPGRLQRAVRPSASYARSLAVLARAKAAGLVTKSGIVVGMGETEMEVLETLRDLHNIGVDIVTIGQYLQPTPRHVPVHRFVEPAEFDRYRKYGHLLGIHHVESGPMVRSSYHAKEATNATNRT